MYEAVLDVVAEYPEEQSVAEQVAPPSVQNHRDERSENVDRVVVDDARHPAAEWNRSTNRGQMRELSWYHSQIAHARRQRLLVESGSLNQNPGCEHDGQDGIRHPWRANCR